MDQIAKQLSNQSAALRLRAKRQETIASNIANSETPNYKAKEMDFKKSLENALSAGKKSNSQATQLRTNPGHLAISPKLSRIIHSSDAVFKELGVTAASLDNNSVDMDRERQAFAENAIKYDASTKALNGQIKALSTAMTAQ